MNNKFSIREAVAVGWQKALANWGTFFLILISSWVISALVNGFSASAEKQGFLSAIISFLGWILLMLIQIGLIRVTLKVLDGGKGSMKDFSTSFMQFLWFLVASILGGIAVVIGFVLLIIPGIIIGLRLQFYSYLVIEKDLGPIEALKRSWEMTRGQTWRLFLLGLAMMGINIVGMLVLMVGLFITIPLTIVATAFVYRKLLAAAPAVPAAQAAPGA